MAAGGFLIAAAVYILNWKKYKCIVRRLDPQRLFRLPPRRHVDLPRHRPLLRPSGTPW